MPSKKTDSNRDDQISSEEALRRMDQALRGSKIAGPRPLKDKPKGYDGRSKRREDR